MGVLGHVETCNLGAFLTFCVLVSRSNSHLFVFHRVHSKSGERRFLKKGIMGESDLSSGFGLSSIIPLLMRIEFRFEFIEISDIRVSSSQIIIISK